MTTIKYHYLRSSFSRISSLISSCNNSNRMEMSTASVNTDSPLIAIDEAKRFAKDCFQAVGTPESHAETMAELLIDADHRGHVSHGMNRLEMYIKDIEAGICDAKAVPNVLKESPATAWVDGQNGLGGVIGIFCMDLALKKAKEVGIGWVSVKGSNHYGMAAFYSLRAIKEGVIGMTCTNTSPFMAPTRSKAAALGTNPIALGAPAVGCDHFMLDMATTAVAVGKIEIQRRKGQPIPEGWAQDADGNSTTDANVAYKAGILMPLGGSELNSGFKGYGLGMLVEIFSGLLAGGNSGPNVRKWGTTDTVANLGQSFVAINPEFFAPDFKERLSELTCYLRRMEPADPNKPVMVPGDPERIQTRMVDEAGGLRYLPDQMKTCESLSQRLKVEPMKPLK